MIMRTFIERIFPTRFDQVSRIVVMYLFVLSKKKVSICLYYLFFGQLNLIFCKEKHHRNNI